MAFQLPLSLLASGQEAQNAATKEIPEAGAPAPASKESGLALLAERQSLAAEMSRLLKTGAGPDEIVHWHEKNSERMANIQQSITAMPEEGKKVPIPLIPVTARPEGVSKSAGELFDKRMALQNSRAEIMNRMSGATPAESSQALETWRQNNASELDSLRVLARQAGDESAGRAHPAPASFHVPPGASPVLESFLKERFQLQKARAEFLAGHLGDAPEQRQLAEKDWKLANQSRIRALQLKADQLSEETKAP